MAATASSIFANGMSVGSLPRQQPLDVLGGDVDLEVHEVAWLPRTEGRDLGRVWDHRDGEAIVEDGDDREAHAVDGDRALLDDVAQEFAILHADLEVGHGPHDLAEAVDVTLHQMTAEAIAEPHRPFQVHRVA